jgi:phosphoribosylaminoimidazole-succinocarboxamide synthase
MKNQELHEYIGHLSQLESLNKNLQLLEMPSLVINIYQAIEQLHKKQDAMNDYMVKVSSSLENGDRYLTPQEAMEYLSFSKGTFDKYRYSSQIKIKGYQLDGKTWFKKSDLDRFMLTYQAKSGGLA